MAKLPALISALAQVDGRERKAVDHIGRTIRERGYITTGKRGHGAAEMTTAEAVNLIIALNGSDSPKEAPIAIDRFRSLLFQPYASVFDANPETHPQFIKDVMAVHTFGEALEALVDSVPDVAASFWRYMLEAFPQADPDEDSSVLMDFIGPHVFGVEVEFRRYSARIIVFSPSMDGVRRNEFEAFFQQDSDRLMAGFYGNRTSDRRVNVTIGTRTLFAVWQALHPGEKLRGVPDLLPSHDDETEAASEE